MVARTIAVSTLGCDRRGFMLFDDIRELSGAGYIAPGVGRGPWTGPLERLGTDADNCLCWTVPADSSLCLGSAPAGAEPCSLHPIRAPPRRNTEADSSVAR